MVLHIFASMVLHVFASMVLHIFALIVLHITNIYPHTNAYMNSQNLHELECPMWVWTPNLFLINMSIKWAHYRSFVKGKKN